MLIQPRNRENAFNVTQPVRKPAALTAFPPPSLQQRTGAVPPLSPAYQYRDKTTELDRLLGALGPGGSSRQSKSELAQIDTASPQAISTLSSFAEMNRATTSYEKVSLTFGNSSTVATLSGTYAASGAAASATSLKIEFTEATTIGYASGTLKFDVKNQSGTTIFSYDGTANADESISLGADIGLSVSFSAGTAGLGAYGSTQVYSGTATTVDLDARFDDNDLNARPRFEGNAQVVAGSFQVNGTTNEVKANDTVRTVVQRLQETLTDVTAEVSGDRITLSTLSNSQAPIVVSNDSSGFVAATKLAGAVTDQGNVRGDRARLADTAQFQSVQAGGFKVNGTFVSVDPTTDSLASVLDRMRTAGVQGYYDQVAKTVVLHERGETGAVFEDDSSGFLAAAGIPTESKRDLGPSMQLSPGTAARLQKLVEGNLAELVEKTGSALGTAAASQAKTTLAAKKAQAAYGKTSKTEERPTGLRILENKKDEDEATTAPKRALFGKTSADSALGSAFATSEESDSLF